MNFYVRDYAGNVVWVNHTVTFDIGSTTTTTEPVAALLVEYQEQQLVLVTKDEAGDITTRQMLPVRFVPLTGDH